MGSAPPPWLAGRRSAEGSRGRTPSVQVDRLSQFLEEALGDPLRLARQDADLAEDRLLLGRQVLGDHDLHDDELVATAARADVGHAAAGQPEGLAVLRPRRDRDLDRAVQRRHLDAVAQGRLDHVDPQLVDHVLVLAAQVHVAADPDHDVQVALGTAPVAGLPLAGEPDLGAGVHPGRDADAQALGALRAALATALGAGRAQEAARAAAARAGRDVDDRAEDRLGLPAHLAGAAAGGARLRAG